MRATRRGKQGSVHNSCARPKALNSKRETELRLVTFSESARKPAKTGIIGRDGGVIDIARAAKTARVALPFDAGDMISLVASGRKGIAAIKKATAKVTKSHHALGKVK